MKCVVITPVGPGHEALAEEAKASVQAASGKSRGPFAEIEHLVLDDTKGAYGRSRVRNAGVKEAAAKGADWLFFLDADDILSPLAFDAFGRYADGYDAVWGNIAELLPPYDKPRLRSPQVRTVTSLEEVLLLPPYLTLQMGHFVRLAAAQATPFNETMDTGEDFDYYMRIWAKYRCIKGRDVFFVNRRGQHSQGPRSADGQQWGKAVRQVLDAALAQHHLVRSSAEARGIVNAKSCEFRDYLRQRKIAVGSHYFGLSRTMPYWGTWLVDCYACPPFKMISQNDDLVVCSIYWSGSYEPASLGLWLRLLAQPGAVLDLGGYTGLYSLAAAAAKPDCIVHAFEPMPRNAERLRANIEVNAFPNVRLFPHAVGEREGETVFSIFNDGDFLTSGGSLMPHSEKAPAMSYPVRLVSIDRHVQESGLGRVALIKIDVEGAEVLALRGMSNLLDRDGPDLLLEVLEGADGAQLTSFLSAKGYRFFRIDEKSGALHAVNSLAGTSQPDDLNRLVTRKTAEELRGRFAIDAA